MAHPVIDALNALEPHELRNLVDENTGQYIGNPDSSTSPGSVFLVRVRNDLTARLGDFLTDPPRDGLTLAKARTKVEADMYRMRTVNDPDWLVDEIAPYDNERWPAFVDLWLGGWEIPARDVKVRTESGRFGWVAADQIMTKVLIEVAKTLHKGLFDLAHQVDKGVDYYAEEDES